jgi:ABC-type polysaccharide transport system permease subunit
MTKNGVFHVKVRSMSNIINLYSYSRSVNKTNFSINTAKKIITLIVRTYIIIPEVLSHSSLTFLM